MKKIFSILAIAFAALAVVGCNKETTDDLTAELIGSWRGTTATQYVNGKPANEVTVTLTFTQDKLTIDFDGKASTYSYTASESDGKKWFTTEDGSVFYTISGTTMTIDGGNTQLFYALPKTLEKALL